MKGQQPVEYGKYVSLGIFGQRRVRWPLKTLTSNCPSPPGRAGSKRLADGRSHMENNPSLPTPKEQEAFPIRRRSTRIDYVTTVILSGKDGSGTPFREYTQTVKVNLHGCKIRTSYRILVGMLVTLECPKAGASGKASASKLWDPKPGVAGHEIALQLIKPQNLWGVPNPPADWETVAKAIVQGRAVQTESPGRAATPVAPSPAALAAVPRFTRHSTSGAVGAPSRGGARAVGPRCRSDGRPAARRAGAPLHPIGGISYRYPARAGGGNYAQ